MKTKILVFLSTFLLFCSLFGCSNYEAKSIDEDFIFNAVTAEWIIADRDYIYKNIELFPIMISRKTGKVFTLLRDPFLQDKTSAEVRFLYSDGNFLYYLRTTKEFNEYSIVKRDNKTLKENVIYKKTFYETRKQIFLGLAETQGRKLDDFFSSDIPNIFFVVNKKLFLVLPDKVYLIDLSNKKESVAFSESVFNYNISLYNNTFYFINEFYDIYSYHIDSEKLEKLCDSKAGRLLVEPNGIYYNNLSDKNSLYLIDFNGENNRKIIDKNVLSYDCDHEYLYYILDGENNLYRASLDGKAPEVLFELKGLWSVVNVESCNVLYLEYETESGEVGFYEFNK